MTDEKFKRAMELRNQITTCKNMLTFENSNLVYFANNECSFMKKDLFITVKNKLAKLQAEYENL